MECEKGGVSRGAFSVKRRTISWTCHRIFWLLDLKCHRSGTSNTTLICDCLCLRLLCPPSFLCTLAFFKQITGRSLVFKMATVPKLDMRMYSSRALCCPFMRIRAVWSRHTPAMTASKCCGTTEEGLDRSSDVLVLLLPFPSLIYSRKDAAALSHAMKPGGSIRPAAPSQPVFQMTSQSIFYRSFIPEPGCHFADHQLHLLTSSTFVSGVQGG